MPYIKQNKTPKKKPKTKTKTKTKHTSLFLVFAVSVLIILLIVVLVVINSSTFAATPSSKSMPIVQVDVLMKNIHPEVVIVVPKIVKEIPEAYLKIPKIGVNAVIKSMGVTSDGFMLVPGNRFDVGWFNLGARPGQTGNAVIGGHNRWASEPGVFANLNQLKIGDVLSVVDEKGVSTSFMVKDMRIFDATDTNSGVFDSDSGVHLNLITCTGTWDPSTKTYTKRLVVFTDAVHVVNKVVIAQNQAL